MRRILMLASFAIVSVVAGSRLSAQTSTASLAVSATVSKNCTITTAPVGFGAYDPVTANATAPLDGIGTITVTCTKGATADVRLAAGANAQGATRRMSGGGSFLTYELYKDAGRTTVWGNTVGDGLTIPAAPDGKPRNYTVYGRVPATQDVTVGGYTDTVVATVNF